MRSLCIFVVSIAVIYAETTARTTGAHKAVGTGKPHVRPAGVTGKHNESVKPHGTGKPFGRVIGKPPGKPFVAKQLTKEEEIAQIEAKITNFFTNFFKGYRHIKPAQKPSVDPHGATKKGSTKPPVQPAPVKPAVLPAKV